MRKRSPRIWLAALLSLILSHPVQAATEPAPQKQSSQNASKPSKQELDQLTAQIALYPDALLAQLLMASTYPDQFAAAAKWSKAHPDAKGDEAVKQVQDQGWDPSVASLVAFPQVLITLGAKPDYVKNLGDAFLAQPDAVMDSIQDLRAKAKAAGNLQSNEQVKVSNAQEQPAAGAPAQAQPPPTQTIVVQSAQPTVAYVPTYDPAVVYGPWPYPAYPPAYYPPPAGYWFSTAVVRGVAWGVGIGVSNAMWGGCNWGGHNVYVNNVNRYNNINPNRQINAAGNRADWHHNPENRSAAYRGGDATRQRLDQEYQAGNREEYRGREASRERANEAVETRENRTAERSEGRESRTTERSEGRDERQNANRDAAREQAQNVDREAARQRAQSADLGAARQTASNESRDNALRGADSRQATAQANRGASSHAGARSGGAPSGRRGGGGGGRR